MDAIVVGIDVSKDRLDVHVHPSGESFAVARKAEGLEALLTRIAPLGVAAVGVEATGGFESIVAASLSAAGLPIIVVNPAQVRAFAQALASAPRPIRSMQLSSLDLSRPPSRRYDRFPMQKRAFWPIW